MVKRLNKNNFLRWDGEFATTESVVITFAPVVNANINTLYTSNPLAISGIISPKPISVSAGFEYRINGGAFTSVQGTISPADVVEVRGTSANIYNSPKIGTLTIGSSTGNFSITTKVAPKVPFIVSVSQVATPYADANLFYSINGIEQPAMFVDESRSLMLDAGDVVDFYSNSFDGVWPAGASRLTRVFEQTTPIFNVVDNNQFSTTSGQFIAAEGKYYNLSAQTSLSGGGGSSYNVILQKFGSFGGVMIITLNAANSESITFDGVGEPSGETKSFSSSDVGIITVDVSNDDPINRYWALYEGGVFIGALNNGDTINPLDYPTGFTVGVNTGL